MAPVASRNAYKSIENEAHGAQNVSKATPTGVRLLRTPPAKKRHKDGRRVTSGNNTLLVGTKNMTTVLHAKNGTPSMQASK